MGQDYSYTQPTESEASGAYTIYSQTEDDIVEDQAESLWNDDAERTLYPPQPEVEFGFPKRCYCGGEPLLDTSYTKNDPGRRFYSYENRDDGDYHVWKWWDVAAMGEIRAMETHYGQLAEKVDFLACSTDYETELDQIKSLHIDTEQKVAKLEKTVCDLAKKKPRFEMIVGVITIVVVIIGMRLMF